MGFKCGIVGLPNVGKSTIFNALTKAGIEAKNYPFCTIDPNVGTVPMPDERLDQIAKIVNPQNVIPTTMEFVDIAGLVKGASEGEGLGNKFLANIRESQAIAHVVRCFEDDDIVHVDGKLSPESDIETINTELLLADLETIEKSLHKITKNAKSGDKKAVSEKNTLEQLQNHLNDNLPARSFTPKDEVAADTIKNLNLLTVKPTMYIANVNEDGFADNKYLDLVKNIAQKESAVVVPVCAKIEEEIAQLDDEDKNAFLTELGLRSSGLDRVIAAGYKLLGLETFFTAGEKEVRAWTISIDSSAPQAAGKIHTDFEKGFIRAEVISFSDFIQYNGEAKAKEAGKWRLEGKEYIVKDGDIIHFRFNV